MNVVFSGLGYIVGSTVAAIADEWQWGVRVTPIAGADSPVFRLFDLGGHIGFL